MDHSELASPEERRRQAMQSAVQYIELPLEQLWMRFLALGGDADLLDVEAHLAGLLALPEGQQDLLAHAVNERLDEILVRHRVPYSRAFRQPTATTGPLAALGMLLSAVGSVPPERLPDLAAEAGAAMDVAVTMYLIDHEQRRLVRMPSGRKGRSTTGGATTRAAVDSTMAGRAFRSVRIVSSTKDGRPRLWVPILDGADRLGVLEVALRTAAELYDPALRQQCAWLASLLGHLVASMDPYGDRLERPRRTQPLTPSAELIWQQLPPLTGATDAFELAGMLEPAYEVGGDAFDYALSEDTVSLAMFDAMGHGLNAGLMSAATLAAYRSVRRDARSVYDQSRAIDDVIASTFPGSAFVTGVVAEVDVRSGRLRYVNAGHPPPLVLRQGKVVKELSGGRRVPFGLDTNGVTVGEEALQPGDWLVLYTDGITEARDTSGAWFGEERLIEFLTRAASAAQPPPETVRRLTKAVLDHQGGLLQDDASVLLACWSADRLN